jgi:mono/diheme cytochrome c family protein
MNDRLFFRGVIAVLVPLMLVSCGSGSNPGDVHPGVPVNSVITGPNSFLLFPNPLVQPDGSLQTNSTAYAQAYYAAIDPLNAKDTLAKWKAANGFDSGTGTQTSAVFGDVRDLGYGRRMTGRQNADGTIAFMVENYEVDVGAGYGYSGLNLDAAVRQNTKWHIGTNGIEFSPGPGGVVKFAKFFSFDPNTGARLLAGDLDGRGNKAMPGICINCHGGRADPLTPADAATGKPLFPLVQNSVSLKRGDTQARLQMFAVGSFDFSALPGFTRTDQEAALKVFNKFVLCTYPLPGASTAVEDACRPAAGANEWQGTAATLLKAAYGGDGLPNGAFSDTYVPPSWSTAGQTTLYQNVIAPACRTCHVQRGTADQADIDFTVFSNFQGYSERIKAHVIDRGNMPLAKIVYDKFWSTNMPDTIATFLQDQGYTVRDSVGAVLQPGRPVADAGPDRVVAPGVTSLSAGNSQFASSYTWSFVMNPGSATLTNPTSATPTFTTTAGGTYVLQLVVGNGTTLSAPRQLTIVVNPTLTPLPSTIRFADIKNILQTAGCTGCHSNGTTSLATAAITPIVYDSVDRNGDGIVNATDDLWFYTELRGRINFTDIIASPLLRKPSGSHHGGGLQANFDATLPPGSAGRANYDLFLNWILNGAPQ